MKKYLTLTWEALIQVYSQKSYFILTFSFALIVFVTNGLIINYHLLWSNFSLKLVFYLIVGWIMLLPLPALIFIILICLLGGVVFSGSIYLLRKQLHEKKLSLSGTGSSAGTGLTGIIAAIIVPACPSCALSIFSVLGLSSILGFLPFKGLELGFLAVIILVLSLFYLANKITTKVCIIKK